METICFTTDLRKMAELFGRLRNGATISRDGLAEMYADRFCNDNDALRETLKHKHKYVAAKCMCVLLDARAAKLVAEPNESGEFIIEKLY